MAHSGDSRWVAVGQLLDRWITVGRDLLAGCLIRRMLNRWVCGSVDAQYDLVMRCGRFVREGG